MTVLGTSFFAGPISLFFWFLFSRRRALMPAHLMHHFICQAKRPGNLCDDSQPALSCLGSYLSWFLLPEYPESSVFTLLLDLIVRRPGEMTYSISVLKNSRPHSKVSADRPSLLHF